MSAPDTNLIRVSRTSSLPMTQLHGEDLPAYSKEDPQLATTIAAPAYLDQHSIFGNETQNRSSPLTTLPTCTARRYSGQTHSTFTASYVEKRKQSGPERRRKCCCCWLLWIFVIAILLGVAIEVLANRHAAPKISPRTFLNYKLQSDYVGDTFFNGFDFFTDTQNETFTNTFVNETQAVTQGLISTSNTSDIKLSINSNSSVRIVSQRSFSRGLFVFNINDVPLGCDQTATIRLSSTPHYPSPNDITIFQTRGYSADSYLSLRTNGNCRIGGITTATKNRVYRNACHASENNDVVQTNSTVPQVTNSTSNGTATQSSLSVLSASAKGAPSATPTTSNLQCIDFVTYFSRTYFTPLTLVIELESQGLRAWWFDTLFPGDSKEMGDQLRNDNIDMSTWPDPNIEFTMLDQGCDMTSNFGPMHLVADIARCGNYGHYDYYRHWTDGEWCKQECAAAYGKDYYHSSTWQWSQWKVFAPIDKETGQFLYPNATDPYGVL